jgi:hypothetical protein
VCSGPSLRLRSIGVGTLPQETSTCLPSSATAQLKPRTSVRGVHHVSPSAEFIPLRPSQTRQSSPV